MNEERLRERNFNIKLPTRFRYAYVFKPGSYDYSLLKPVVERFVYATDGYAESAGEVHDQLEESLKDFDATKDILIPIGGASICTQVGSIVARQCITHNWDAYMIAFYTTGQYDLWRIPLDPSEPAWRFEMEGIEKMPKD